MSEDEVDSKDDNATAQCGACKSEIPANSDKCPECNVSFSGLEEVNMGECGACQAIIPLDSKSCPKCEISFVLDDLIINMSNWMKESGFSVTDVFGKWDTNDDGVLSTSEIRNGLIGANLAALPEDEVDRFIHQIDLNHDSNISLGELSALLLLPLDSEDNEENTDEAGKTSANYSENVLNQVMEKHGIDDKEAFLLFTNENYDDGNSYLNKKELTEAAIAWNEKHNVDDEVDNDDDSESDTTEDSQDDADQTPADDETVDDDDSTDEADDIDVEEDDDSTDEAEETEDDTDDEEVSESSSAETFTRLLDAVADSGETSRSLFEKLDRNESDNVDPDEFKKAVSDAFGDDFSVDDLDAIIKVLDADNDGFIDIIELTNAFEEPEEVVDKLKGKKDEPEEWQRFLMRHYENLFPIAYVLVALFIGVWVVNGLIGPVDGSGGPVAFDGDSTVWVGGIEPVEPGEIYQCDKDFQESKCRNSLTPLAGDEGSSSMPKGFYWDGIMFMILGFIGGIGILLLQMQTKKWRVLHRKKKTSDDNSDDDEDSDDEDSDDSDDEEEDSDDDDDDEDSDDQDSDDSDDEEEESDDDNDDDDEDSDDEDSDEADNDEEIDVGSHVGIEHDGEEWYGVIVKFDDNDDEVLVKSDDDDEEYWVPFDSLFMD
ncbi:MAG TPA: hypothetical protein QF802_05675 [Candidatus Thalassarchaeaceae archaeon]|nr:hypothetical protein [Candidatus Thalassarchaeaceae archaeon]